MAQVLRSAAPLAPAMRSAFLEEVAVELKRNGPIGDGLVHRICEQVQKRYLNTFQVAGRSLGK
jgi:hypothetical protein